MQPTNDSLKVTVAGADEQTPALWLSLAEEPAEQRKANAAALLAAAASGKLTLAGLLIATRGERLVGSCFCQFTAGKTCTFWPVQLVQGESETTADRLLAASRDLFRKQGLTMAQALLPLDHGLAADRLIRGGFEHALDLLYLAAARDRFPSAAAVRDWSLEPFREDQLQRLQSVIERTYVGSLDCPRLEGARQASDVVAGYRHSGVFSPDRWFFIRREDRDVGCLILTDHPADRQWELVYLGIVPEARGRGLGLEATRQAQFLAGAAGAERLVLAVDAANSPAIALYAAAGFETWDRRSVFLWFADNAE